MSKNYTKIEFPCGCTLEQAVMGLLKYKEHGALVYGDFNGHTLYSDTVTMEGAYLEVVGVTKEEFDRQQEETRQKLKRAEEEHKARIPDLTKEWIAKGHLILDEKYWEKWDECVPIRLGDLYKGMELKDCLEIVKALNDGCTLDEAKEIIYKQGHSGMSFGLVRAMVQAFCDRGNEFAEYVK